MENSPILKSVIWVVLFGGMICFAIPMFVVLLAERKQKNKK